MNSMRKQSFIRREHLLNQLSAALNHQLTLIIAPSGYGKTTLVSQFVETITIPVAWQTLDRQDQDVQTLFEHSVESLSKVITGINSTKSVEHMTTGELATSMTSYLRDNVINDFLYVI